MAVNQEASATIRHQRPSKPIGKDKLIGHKVLIARWVIYRCRGDVDDERKGTDRGPPKPNFKLMPKSREEWSNGMLNPLHWADYELQWGEAVSAQLCELRQATPEQQTIVQELAAISDGLKNAFFEALPSHLCPPDYRRSALQTPVQNLVKARPMGRQNTGARRTSKSSSSLDWQPATYSYA